jgi:hypothetical protein
MNEVYCFRHKSDISFIHTVTFIEIRVGQNLKTTEDICSDSRVLCACARVCMRVSVNIYGYMFVYALDSFRPILGQVSISSETGDESSSSIARGLGGEFLDKLRNCELLRWGYARWRQLLFVVCVP